MKLGYSTGAFAKSRIAEGVSYLRDLCVKAIEISLLREHELLEWKNQLDALNLSSFEYVSVHAPSKLVNLTEEQLVSILMTFDNSWHIVVHPNIINNADLWRPLGQRLLVENMDQRGEIGQTVEQLVDFFSSLPEAGFCMDVGHARQVDPTMALSYEFISAFGDRLTEIHMSELDDDSRHIRMCSDSIVAYKNVLSEVKKDVAVILESVVDKNKIDEEMKIASITLGYSNKLQSHFSYRS